LYARSRGAFDFQTPTFRPSSEIHLEAVELD
jgi:hypothetical protein